MNKPTLFVAAFLSAATAPIYAQYSAPYSPAPAPAPYPASSPYPANAPYFASSVLAPNQLDQLLSPIALYPDPLLAAMLPAATHPDQIAAAANFDAANTDPSQFQQQPWDESVQELAHYPTVVSWMAQNSDWTNQVGAAVAQQQQDVLNSIQRLRANARASGLLVSTPQQQVVINNGAVQILPAQSNVVYVPEYNPSYVETTTYSGPPPSLTFGPSFALGAWATFGLDWANHSLWIDHSRNDHRDWSRPGFAAARNHQRWEAPRSIVRSRSYNAPAERESVARPAPMETRNYDSRRNPGYSPTGRANSPAMEGRGNWNRGGDEHDRANYRPAIVPGGHESGRQPADVRDHGRRDDDHRDSDDRRRDDDR